MKLIQHCFNTKPGLKALGLIFVFFTILQIIWLKIDQRALVVERHYLAAAHLAHEWRHSAVGAQYPEHGDTSPYPPLPVYFTAVGMAIMGISGDIAVLTLLPFAWLLLWSVWRTARLYMPEAPALATATLALAFHHVVVVEPNFPPFPLMKEYLLDLPLSAITAWSFYLMLRAQSEGHLKHRLALGLAAGLGALTKVTYPIYLLLLLVTARFSRSGKGLSWRLWITPAALAAIIALPWYLWHAPDLLQALYRFEFNPAWAEECGMPPIFSLASPAYAARLLLRLLSLPTAIITIIALALVCAFRPNGWKPAVFGLLASQIALLLVWGKSERLLAPIIFFPALVVGLAINLPPARKHRTAAAVLVIAAAGLRILLMNGFVPQSCLTAFPTQERIEIEPCTNDWAIAAMLDKIEEHRDKTLLTKVAVTPFLGRFRFSSFEQKTGERTMRLEQSVEWTIRSDAWTAAISNAEFIVTKTGCQGLQRFTPAADAIAAWVQANETSKLSRLADFSLPDGATATLWRQKNEHQAWSKFACARPRDFLVSFNEQIRMLGYQIRREPDRLELRFQWWCDSTSDKDARLFIQVREGYHNLATTSFTPGAGLYPTALWQPDTVIDETYLLPLPEKYQTGDFDVWIGWHRRHKRLPVRNSIFPIFMKAVCIGKTAPACQGAIADFTDPASPVSPLRLPPLPGR